MKLPTKPVGPKAPDPNDIVPALLSDESIDTFKKLVASGATELEVDKHIRQHLHLLASIFSGLPTGNHGMKAFPQQTIRPHVPHKLRGLVPDYLLYGGSSDGVSWIVVELKRPDHTVFVETRGKIKFSDAANAGIIQLLGYIDFCSEHQSMMRDVLKMDGFREPRKGILVIGRENEFSNDERRRKLKAAWNRANDRLQIMTYDFMLNSLYSRSF